MVPDSSLAMTPACGDSANVRNLADANCCFSMAALRGLSADFGAFRLAQLDQRTAGGRRVQESDQVPVRTAPRPVVDEADSLGFERGQLRREVVHLIREMMKARGLVAEIPLKGGRRVERFEQLDARLAGSQTDDVDPLLFHAFPVTNCETKRRIRLFRSVQIGNDQRNVIERAVHQTAAAGLCTEKTARIASQTSPSVHPASTASTNSGMSGASPAAARLTAASPCSARLPSRRERNAARRSR